MSLSRALLSAALCTGLAATAVAEPGVEKIEFGLAHGQPVQQYVLTNKHGLQARLMTYGATWTHMLVPDRGGVMGDVLLGFDTLDPYLKEQPYFGATVGRVANRIARGKFTLDGKDYALATNNGPNALHGGLQGYDKVVWEAQEVERKEGPAVKFSYTDPAGHNGYPGEVKNQVMFTLTDSDELRIDYTASTDKNTPINLTNHAYFNLNTPTNGDVLEHVVTINADRYTPVDDTLIPTGAIEPVVATPFNFTTPKSIGRDVEKVGSNPTGYDHNYVLNARSTPLGLAATVTEPKSGRVLEVYTDQPGLQFYTGNFLDGSLTGKSGVVYRKHSGFCMETQHFPDSIHQPSFPNTVLHPGETFRSSTVYKFRSDRKP